MQFQLHHDGLGDAPGTVLAVPLATQLLDLALQVNLANGNAQVHGFGQPVVDGDGAFVHSSSTVV